MSATLGWALAVLAVAAGYWGYGWQGVVLAVTVIVFWLLLQFGRALRVMRNASGRPVGAVDSAVMLNARLQRGMTLMQVIRLTQSLGLRAAQTPETWTWTDDGGASVTLVMANARLAHWTLSRPADPADPADPAE